MYQWWHTMRLRFSVRLLILLLALVALALLPIASQIHSGRRQEWIARELNQNGVRIGFEHAWDNQAREIDTVKPPPGPAMIRWLLGEYVLAKVDFVAFVEFDGNRDVYKLLPELKHVKWVSFVNGNVDEALVTALGGMQQLEFLNLSDTDLDDRQLEQLCQIPSLKHINIGGTSVTPAGVQLYRELRPENTISSGFDPVFMEGLLRLMAMSGTSSFKETQPN